MGLDTALEGKEPGCGSGWRDRPGTEGTTVGQPTQGREWCFIGLEAAGYPASRHGDFPPRRGVIFIRNPEIVLDPSKRSTFSRTKALKIFMVF